MDSQSPVIPDPASMSLLMLAGHLPPTDQYSTFIHLFPGNNAHPPWGTKGFFQFGITAYVGGRETGRIESGVCDENGNMKVEINPAAETGAPAQGMYIVECHHAKEIPVEVYGFHVHKATGTYVSCNISPFIGDKLYPEVHTNQLENTLFWPGIIADEDNEPYSVVVNPYDAVMGFQIHLMTGSGVVARTETLRLKAKTSQEFSLCRLFEDFERDIRKHNGMFSYCISSQYKLVTYFMLRNKIHKVMSMMDHLHNFCLS